MMITKELLFDNNVKQIVRKIETDYSTEIQHDFDTYPNKYDDLFTWLEFHPQIVGEYFIKHLIDFGFTNDDIN
jgi:hypothetical protein